MNLKRPILVTSWIFSGLFMYYWVDISFLDCKGVSAFCCISAGFVLYSLESKSIPSDAESHSACAVIIHF